MTGGTVCDDPRSGPVRQALAVGTAHPVFFLSEMALPAHLVGVIHIHFDALFGYQKITIFFVVTGITTLGGTMMDPLYAPFVHDILQGGSAAFGWFLTTHGVGGVIGGLVAWIAFDGYQTSTMNFQSFSQVAFAFAVTPKLLTTKKSTTTITKPPRWLLRMRWKTNLQPTKC